jgi:protein-S-isoprenylcysteine O-methyltransferase Ste14
MKEKEGIATEIARKEGLTPEQRKDELMKAGLDFLKLVHEKSYMAGAFIIWLILCFLPGVVQLAHWQNLDFLLNLYMVKFPGVVAIIAGGLAVIGIPLQFTERLRVNRGGCKDEHHTVTLIREGIFKVVRHPEYTYHISLIILIPIAVSPALGCTILSIIGIILAIGGYVLLAKREEAFNTKKWGDEYRRYMKEVPRFNILLGLWRLIFKKQVTFG